MSSKTIIDPVTGIDLTEEDVRRNGAIDTLLALRELERSAETIDNINDTLEEYYGKRLADAKAFAAAIGPLSPRLEGVIIALAEYIHTGITTGAPNLDAWLPVISMSEAEYQANVQKCEAVGRTLEAS